MRITGKCLYSGEEFSLESRHIAYGGALFKSIEKLAAWTVENKKPGEFDTVAEEYEIKNPHST